MSDCNSWQKGNERINYYGMSKAENGPLKERRMCSSEEEIAYAFKGAVWRCRKDNDR